MSLQNIYIHYTTQYFDTSHYIMSPVIHRHTPSYNYTDTTHANIYTVLSFQKIKVVGRDGPPILYYI